MRHAEPVDPPPRTVSRWLALSVLFGDLRLFFTCAVPLVLSGLILLVGHYLKDVSSIAVALFGRSTTGEVVCLDEAPGRTISSTSPQGSSKRHFTVVRYVVDGRAYHARSEDQSLDVGWRVGVRYSSLHPRLARAEATPAGVQDSAWAALVVLALAFGVGIPGWVRGVRGLRLLREGEIALARVVGKEATGRTENGGDAIYAVALEFVPGPGSASAPGAKVCFAHRTSDPALLLDEAEEPILYDPRRPTRAVPLDDLPGGAYLDGRGGFVPGARGSFLFVLAIVGVVALPAAWVVTLVRSAARPASELPLPPERAQRVCDDW